MAKATLTVLLAAFLILGCTSQAPAVEQDPDAWTSTDTTLQIVYTTLHCMDWAQTLHMARNPQQFEEGNSLVTPFLGDHPSTGRVNAVLGTSLLLHTGIAALLPQKTTILGMPVHARTLWQAFWIGVEADAVNTNRKIIGISFHF